MIYKVPASGGTPVPVTAFDESRGEDSHRYPQFLPDGRHFLFLGRATVETPDTEQGSAIFAASLDSTDRKLIVATDSSARFAASGHLLFVRADARRPAVRSRHARAFGRPGAGGGDGEPQQLDRGGRSTSRTTGACCTRGAPSQDSRLVWVDREGGGGTIGEPARYDTPALSHDQTRVAVAVFDADMRGSDIWVLDIERGTSTRLTFDPDDTFGRRGRSTTGRSTSASHRSGRGDVYSKSSSGMGRSSGVRLGEGGVLMSVSPDGATGWVVQRHHGRDGLRHLPRRSGESAGRGRSADAVHGGWPGRLPRRPVAPLSVRRIGRSEVYVQSLQGDGGKWQISTDGGIVGRWTREGREIVFQAG